MSLLYTLGFAVTLLSLAAAIALFIRRPSIATGLFLFGTLMTTLVPMVGVFSGREMMTVAILTSASGPLCAAVGLLWYAIALPRLPAAPAKPD